VPKTFDALGDFCDSLREIDILCDAAQVAQADQRKYSAFNKAALLLIAGKFETFSESIVEEFVFKLNALSLPSHSIPDAIRLHHTFYALRSLDKVRNRQAQKEAISLFCSLGKLWASEEACSILKVESKFSFGQHGEAELIKLFEKVGVGDVFEVITLSESLETVSTETPINSVVDFRGIFNSVTNMRNNILHQDASPNLNTDLIRKYRQYFEVFAGRLDEHLATLLRPGARPSRIG